MNNIQITRQKRLAEVTVIKLKKLVEALEVSSFITEEEYQLIKSTFCADEISKPTLQFLRNAVVRICADAKTKERAKGVFCDWDKFDKIENLMSKVTYVLDSNLR